MKKMFKKIFSTVLTFSMIVSGLVTVKANTEGVGATTSPDEGVTLIEQLFKDEFNYEAGSLTYTSSNKTWEGTNSSSDPNVVTVVEETSGNKYVALTERADGWSDGMRKYFTKISEGKVRVSADIMMTAETGGQIEMTSSWNANRPLIKFANGVFYGYADTDTAGTLSKKLISASLNTWYNIDIIADYTNTTYDVLISQNDRLLYKETGLSIKDDNTGFSYLRFRNLDSGNFCVDNVVVEKVNAESRENVIHGVYDTLDGYVSFAEGGVPTGNLTSRSWMDGAAKIGNTSIIKEDNGNKYFSIPDASSSVMFQVADEVLKTGLLRIKFSVKQTGDGGEGAIIDVLDGKNTSAGPVAMHIYGNNVYTRAGHWDSSESKVIAGRTERNEWIDAELTYNLDKNTYSMQLSRNGEVFGCVRDLTINKYNSSEAWTYGIGCIRFRNWGAETQIDNFELEYLSEETEQDLIKTEANFDNHTDISSVVTGSWSQTTAGLGSTALVANGDGKAVSFAASNTNNGIQYNIPNGFSAGEMTVNFSIKSNNTDGGALITFPSGTGNETGLVGLHMYRGSLLTYCNGYSAQAKNLGKITAGEWYDVSITLDMDQKLYNIQIKHDGEVLTGLKNIDLIKYCDPENLMTYIGSVRFVDWGSSIGGAGYEMDDFSISYVDADAKRNFVVTEADFTSAESLWAVKGWTADSSASLSGGKLLLGAGTSAQKALPLIDSGKIAVSYTVNASGGKTDILALGSDGSFKLSEFEGTTEDISITNIIDLDNYTVTYYKNGVSEGTVNIADTDTGDILYDISGIKIVNTGATNITADDLTVSYYVTKPQVSSVIITDVFGRTAEFGEIVNPGVDTIEIDFASEILNSTLEEAITFKSDNDEPSFTLSARAGKCVLTFDKVLKPAETYTLTIGTAVTNINGDALEAPYIKSFTADEAGVDAEITAPYVGTKAIYTIDQLTSGDTLTLCATAVNSTDTDADAVFAVGYYSGNTLVHAQTKNVKINAGAKSFDRPSVEVCDLTGIDRIKIMMIDSLTNLKPYCESMVIEDYLTSFRLYGESENAHTQGICSDNENGYLYHSSSHAIKKYDLKTGELVASTTEADSKMHFGDMVYNPEDGMIYGSAIVYADDDIGYIYVIDTTKLTDIDTPVDKEGLVKLAYIPVPETNYRYAADVDGAAIAPLAGAEAGSEKYLYIAPQTNLASGSHYSVHPVYDLETIKNNAVQYSAENMTHTNNPVSPEKLYHGYTGARQYGAQTLCYIEEKNGLFANHYLGATPGMPNYSKFFFDLNSEPVTETLTGYTDADGEVLVFGDYGVTDAATGMKGTFEAEGQHGMTYLGNDYFYISGTVYDSAMNTTASLFKFVNGEFVQVN